MSADWNGPVFITAENARISADGMVRNFGPEALKICAELATKWAARDDTHAQDVWLTIRQSVDCNAVSGNRTSGGNYVHISRQAHPAV